MAECPVCGAEVKVVDNGFPVCDKCSTVLVSKEGTLTTMNESDTLQPGHVDPIEVLRKIDRLVRRIKEVKDAKKAYDSGALDEIKDLEAELADQQGLYDKLTGRA